MILRDLYDMALKRNRKAKRVKVAKKFAVGMGAVGAGIGMLFTAKLSKRRKDMKREELSTAEKIKNAIDIKAEAMKESVDKVQKNLSKAKKDASKKKENIKDDMKDVSKTAGDIKDDMKDGLDKTKKVIQKTVKNVSKEWNN